MRPETAEVIKLLHTFFANVLCLKKTRIDTNNLSCVQMLAHIELVIAASMFTPVWRLHVKTTRKAERLILDFHTSLLSVTSQYQHAPVLTSFGCCSFKKLLISLQDDCGGHRNAVMAGGIWLFHLILLLLFALDASVSWMPGRWGYKHCAAGVAQSRAKQTHESELSKEQGLFFLSLFFFLCPVSVMLSLHQTPLAIVQQQAASLHMFGYCSITLLLPPAHSFNRPCWLTCYTEMISTPISFNLPQPCKNINVL